MAVQPLQRVASDALNVQISTVLRRIAADFPDVTAPDIVIVSPPPTGQTTNALEHLAAEAVFPFFQPSPFPSDWPDAAEWNQRYPHGVVVFQRQMYDKLTKSEVVAVLTHEYGHYFLPHEEKISKSGGDLIGTMRALRSNECEADYFSRRYSPETADTLLSAVSTLFSGIEKPDWNRISTSFDTHPSLSERHLIGQIKIDPSVQIEDVHFSAHCVVLPPPATHAATHKKPQMAGRQTP